MRVDMVVASELPPEPIGSVRDIMVWGDAGEIPARVFTPEGNSLGDPRPILMWFHGGGMVIGDNYVQSDRPARRIANRTHCIVVAVEYGLAPEHPFPAGSRIAARRCGGPRNMAVRSAAIPPGWRSKVIAAGACPPRYPP